MRHHMLHVSRAKSALPRNNAGCNFLVRIQAHDRMGSINYLFQVERAGVLEFLQEGVADPVRIVQEEGGNLLSYYADCQ